jgi:hypothetical protein
MKMPISQDLFFAILSMDAYNRNYNEAMLVNGTQLGNATLLSVPNPTGFVNASFFAQASTWNGQTVISYRGTAAARP